MYRYIQEAVFLPTEDRTARSLSLHLPIHHVHHPQVYAYVRALGENKWQPELPFEPLPFASESVSILCDNCVCVCWVSVCILVCREGHVAPKCDQTVKSRVRAGSATDAVLARTGVPAARARTHDGGCFRISILRTCVDLCALAWRFAPSLAWLLLPLLQRLLLLTPSGKRSLKEWRTIFRILREAGT